MSCYALILFVSITYQTQPPVRKLLIFGPTQPQYEKQIFLLKQDSAGMAERDLVVVTVADDQLIRKYRVAPNQFFLILVGKDGGEKLRSVEPVKLDTIFRLIDSMPMRQTEMRQRKNE